MNEYVIFGDYKKAISAPRCDFKIFDFVQAEDPESAFHQWKTLLIEDTGRNPEEILHEEVYIMEVDGKRHIFDLHTGTLLFNYERPH